MNEPLWSDERIAAVAHDLAYDNEAKYIEKGMRLMRDDYEAARQPQPVTMPWDGDKEQGE